MVVKGTRSKHIMKRLEVSSDDQTMIADQKQRLQGWKIILNTDLSAAFQMNTADQGGH